MDNSNPLQFFISCADEPIRTGLPDDEEDFMNQFDQLAADVTPIANKERVVWSSDEIDVEYRPEQSYWTNTSSPAIKYNPFDGETSKALEGVDNIIVSLPNIGVAFAKLTEFINTMDNVISRVNNFPKTKTHSEIAEASTNLKAELTERKKRLLHGKPEKAPNATKIKWLGQINVLGTLFYHLHKGQDGGEPYISGTVEQVKSMLVDNFVDSDGHDLSKATLDTIFMPSRSEKRAKEGDRIELPNKKVKK